MFLPELRSQDNEDICVVLKLDNYGSHFICDCGDAAALSVKDAQNAEAIFISHTHIDHFINFDTILRHQLGINKRVVICGPKGIASQVQSKINAYTWNLIEEGSVSYEIREVIDENTIEVYLLEPPIWELKFVKTIASNELYATKRFYTEFKLLDHKIPSVAYLFKEVDTVKINIQESGFSGGKWVKELKDAFESQQEDKSIEVEGKLFLAKELFHLLEVKKGHTFGMIMDHAASEENHHKIKETFTGVDLVFIESYYLNEDKEAADQNYHSYAQASGTIMKESKVKKAIPVHFSRKYDEDTIAKLKIDFQDAMR